VDGKQFTAQQTFSWAPNSQHTLTVAQTSAALDTGGFTTCSGLDTTYPYDTRNPTKDSPAQQLLPNGSEYVRADSFTMWLMWKPPVNNAIFVPLAKVPWSWGADVTSADGWMTWTFVSKTPAVNLVPVNATDFPFWMGNMTSNCH
jgi:hypothetical protein